MPKTNQIRRNIFQIVKLILFIGVVFLVYGQINKLKESDWVQFDVDQPLFLVLAFVLVFPNIWLSYRKWKLSLSLVTPTTSLHIRTHSFFAGIVTGMLTPNMIGNFLGRFYYFSSRDRIPITMLTLYSNYAQFLASLTFGWIAFLLLGGLPFLSMDERLGWALGGAVGLAYLIYIGVDRLVAWWFKRAQFRELLKGKKQYRWSLLALSYLRFLVFTVQFLFVLAAFGEPISWNSVFAIWVVYLMTLFTPSLFLGKIGVRESIALWVLTGFGMNGFSILFASLIVWSMNSLLPALVGLYLCKKPEVV